MVEMSKLIQSLYSLVLNQQKQNARRDEHFHKLSQRVYANSFSQTMSARALADNQVVTRSSIRNLDSNKPVTRKNSPEQRSTADKNPSLSSPHRGILKRNEHPQETKRVVSPDFIKPNHKANPPSKVVPPMIRGSLNTNILRKLFGSSVMMSLKGLITIPSVRVQVMQLMGLKASDKEQEKLCDLKIDLSQFMSKPNIPIPLNEVLKVPSLFSQATKFLGIKPKMKAREVNTQKGLSCNDPECI